LGNDGKEAQSAWECFELECGQPVSLPVRVAALGRRMKRKHLGLLCLGLGLGKFGLGLPGLAFGSVGPDAESGSRSVGPVFGSVSGWSVCSRPVLMEASVSMSSFDSMVANDHS
jgi:hypothetical protein